MLKLEASALSDPGRKRSDNQDHVWEHVSQPSAGDSVGLFIVCDGVGGHQGGDFASQWAIEAIKSDLENLFSPGDSYQNVLLSKEEQERSRAGEEVTRVSEIRKLEMIVRLAVQHASQVVHESTQQNPSLADDAGTTITMALVLGGRAVIANVGDSRTYLLRDGRIRQITQDHSLVAVLVASGQILPDEVYTHPQRNLIFRSLGQKDEVQVDTFIELLAPGDFLLLCSDGLWEMLPEESRMLDLVRGAHNPQEAARLLVDAANQAGGDDNIGVVVVAVR